MIIKKINNQQLPEFIIIGGGPAGIITAIHLGRENKSVLLIEAGDTDFDEEIQSHYKGKVTGDRYYPLDVTRLRYLGGSSNHWEWNKDLSTNRLKAGNFAPLDKFDLDQWPINYEELKNFEKKAKDIFGIKNNFIKYEKSIFDSFRLSSLEGGYTNFREKYFDEIKNSKNISLLLKTSVLYLEPNIASNKVNYIQINSHNKFEKINLNKNSKVIIACGGIENSRLLLWSKEMAKNKFLKGLPIGKYWMEHPSGDIGHLIGEKDKVKKIFKKENYCLVPSENFLKSEKINNIRFSVQFWEKTNQKNYKHLIKDLICIAPTYGKKIVESLSNQIVHCVSVIKFSIEQKPNVDNSINLSKNEFDKYKIPQVNLKWKIKEDIFKTLKIGLERLAEETIEKDIGRVGIDKHVYEQTFKNSNNIFGNNHHMGGTIMSNEENVGVVDENLKVKNISNLYVVGSSVFPTGGHFNPTFTIVQLSLRLVRHLTT